MRERTELFLDFIYRNHVMLRPFSFVLIAMLCGCAVAPRPVCHDSERSLTLDTLYFGTASPNGPISPAQWHAFVEQVVSVEFPKGYTVLRAEGAWRGESGELEREESYVVQLVHEDEAEAAQSIERIISRYKKQFHQEAVLRVRTPTCASF
jgi:hypothetical protein